MKENMMTRGVFVVNCNPYDSFTTVSEKVKDSKDLEREFLEGAQLVAPHNPVSLH